MLVVRMYFESLAIQNVPSEDSDQTAQTDLNLRWVHTSKSTFSDVAAQYNMRTRIAYSANNLRGCENIVIYFSIDFGHVEFHRLLLASFKHIYCLLQT